ncbi:hypothetical protein ABIE67_005929 [Streptomyces sp. V4I8]|uniref:hypothetical protein n=1 Tax=Streptomyces sp. V4I8 TaxID=3156469 RepID=UPI003513A871
MSGLWGDGGGYQAWVDFLRRWAAFEPVDPAALPTLTQEHYDADTWVRLTNHLTGALDTRLVAWAEALVRALGQARDDFSYGRELAQARVGLRSVRALAGHPGLPESLRTRLTELIDRQIPQLQAQLEQNLDDELRRGADVRLVERRRRALRDNALTVVLDQSPPQASAPPPATGARDSAPAAPPDPWAYDPAAPPRRRIAPG